MRTEQKAQASSQVKFNQKPPVHCPVHILFHFGRHLAPLWRTSCSLWRTQAQTRSQIQISDRVLCRQMLSLNCFLGSTSFLSTDMRLSSNNLMVMACQSFDFVGANAQFLSPKEYTSSRVCLVQEGGILSKYTVKCTFSPKEYTSARVCLVQEGGTLLKYTF